MTQNSTHCHNGLLCNYRTGSSKSAAIEKYKLVTVYIYTMHRSTGTVLSVSEQQNNEYARTAGAVGTSYHMRINFQ